MALSKEYRVIALHKLAKHTGSDFKRFSDVEKAKEWAIEFGKKKGATSVELSVRSDVRYNSYREIQTIQL